ncbi:MAG: hypothetical protein JOZ69_16515, partial [Myxococcales bacterium]|nr:hypothetical protein [Myxococcales bacterium]
MSDASASCTFPVTSRPSISTRVRVRNETNRCQYDSFAASAPRSSGAASASLKAPASVTRKSLTSIGIEIDVVAQVGEDDEVTAISEARPEPPELRALPGPAEAAEELNALEARELDRGLEVDDRIRGRDAELVVVDRDVEALALG